MERSHYWAYFFENLIFNDSGYFVIAVTAVMFTSDSSERLGFNNFEWFLQLVVLTWITSFSLQFISSSYNCWQQADADIYCWFTLIYHQTLYYSVSFVLLFFWKNEHSRFAFCYHLRPYLESYFTKLKYQKSIVVI